MIQRASSQGIGYSIVELGDVRHIFAVAAPRSGTTLRQQAEDALQTIAQVIGREGCLGSIVQQAVFIAEASQIDECRQILRAFYGPHMPATTYVPQHPCDGKLLAIEALGVGRGQGEVEIQRCCEQLVIARHGGISWIHVAHVTPETTATSVYERSLSGFAKMQEILAKAHARYDQVIRTWLYLGDIVGPEGETQRYKELNRARTDFYQPFRFAAPHVPPTVKGDVYPASTGIGADNRDILMSCIAIATERRDVIIQPLENPLQTSAFEYAPCYGVKSPKFSRAMVLAAGADTTIFISGTASITSSESRHLDDVEAQTHQTLDNIAALISEENFSRNGLAGRGATLADLAFARVYVKRQQDYPQARAACESRLGELPTVYAIADVCRPELLVEIEGIAFSHRP